MSLCERCGRTLDKQKDKDIPFKSSSDEVIAIQAQVRRVEQEVERLTAQRVLLQRRLNAIAASTVTLPYEIIATIFQHACPPLDIHSTSDSPSSDSPSSLSSNGNGSSGNGSNGSSSNKDGGITYPTLPFKLSAVCSQWRDIALSIPHLWSSIAFTLYQSRSSTNANALSTFFHRSGPSTRLSLSLIFASGDEGRDRLENDTPPSLDVLRVFLAHSQRWGTLKIDGLPPEWIPALRAAQGSTPSMDQLWLCPYDNSREQQMVDTFSSAPLLRRVTLDNTFLSAITLPWSNLTHLKVSWVSIDECAEMLRRCPNLLECDFGRILSNAEFHTLPPTDSPPLTLPSLHTLKWSYAGDAWEFHLFERIHFPSLKHFKMKLRYDLSHFSVIQNVLANVLGVTSPGVEKLDLDLGCPWGVMWEILRGVPRVREVRLVDEHDPEFVRGLVGALVAPVTGGSVGEMEREPVGGRTTECGFTSLASTSTTDTPLPPIPTTPTTANNNTLFLPELRSLDFQGNNPTDSTFPKLIVDRLSERWERDTADIYALESVAEVSGNMDVDVSGEVSAAGEIVATSSSGSSSSNASSSTSTSTGTGASNANNKRTTTHRRRRARLETVNLELTSEVYVDGLLIGANPNTNNTNNANSNGSGGEGWGGININTNTSANTARNSGCGSTENSSVAGGSGSGKGVKEGLRALEDAGMKVRIVSGFDGKSWL